MFSIILRRTQLVPVVLHGRGYCLAYLQSFHTRNGRYKLYRTTNRNLNFEAYTVTRNEPLSDEWTYVGKTRSLRYNFGMLEVVDGMYLLGGLSPISLHEETANEVCTIVDTDRVGCEIVGGKSELGLIGHLGQKHLNTV